MSDVDKMRITLRRLEELKTDCEDQEATSESVLDEMPEIDGAVGLDLQASSLTEKLTEAVQYIDALIEDIQYQIDHTPEGQALIKLVLLCNRINGILNQCDHVRGVVPILEDEPTSELHVSMAGYYVTILPEGYMMYERSKDCEDTCCWGEPTQSVSGAARKAINIVISDQLDKAVVELEHKLNRKAVARKAVATPVGTA